MWIDAVQGDITVQEVDVIVNAANSTLLGGGGVDGAIHAAAGPQLLEETRRLRRTMLPDGLPVGDAVATGAGNLPARWVVHTVGPNWNRGERDPGLLSDCFRNVILVAGGLGASSIAIPAISAGAYGWDIRMVARIAVDAIDSVADEGGAASIELVRFVLFNVSGVAAFEDALADEARSLR